MTTKQTQNAQDKAVGIRLQDTVIVALVLLLTSSIGIASALWYRNSRQDTMDGARIVQAEIALRTEEHIQRFVAVPHEINEANEAAFSLLDLSQFGLDDLQSLLLEQIRIFETVSSIYIGSPAGGLLDAGREGAAGALFVIATDGFRSGTFNKYRIDEEGNQGELLLTIPGFDARTRPWYIAAVESGGAAWSDVYVLFSGQDVAIAASRPVYGDSGELQLVLSCDIFLSHIDDFMRSLDYGKTGLGFIIDRSGYIIACSEQHSHVTTSEEDASFQRVQAENDPSPLIRQTARFLQDTFGDFSEIDESFLGEFFLDGDRELIHVLPITDAYGIDWLSVIAIPEEDFLGSIRASAWTTIAFLALALSAAIGTGILIVRRITHPLVELTSAARSLGAGIQVDAPRVGHIREINDLSQSFEKMGTQLNQTLSSLQEEVTEHKQSRQTLQASEERLRMYIEKAPLAIFVMTPDGQYTDVNPEACSMTGYSRDELLQLGLRGLVGNHASPKQPALFKHLTAKGVASGETRIQRRDGSELWLQIDAVALAPDRFVSFASDITQRKQAEESLLHQQKMESLGTMASGVAHEINNPLMGMMNYAELIESRITDSQAQDFAKNILREGERIAHITRNLLSFSQDDAVSRHPADIRTIIEDSLPLVQNAMLRSQVTVETTLDQPVPEIVCSRQQIQQVMVNLLMNARDALDAKYPSYDVKKTIRIRVGTATREGKTWVRTSIEDHGTGMTQSNAALAFDPFFTTKSRDKATGLGLTISFGIIRQHGGEIVIESEEDKGTTIRFDLPAVPADNAI